MALKFLEQTTTHFFINFHIHFFSKIELQKISISQRGGVFPHEHTHTVENPRSHQMTLDYFYGQSGELFSYHGTDESYRGRDSGIKVYLSNGMGTTI